MRWCLSKGYRLLGGLLSGRPNYRKLCFGGAVASVFAVALRCEVVFRVYLWLISRRYDIFVMNCARCAGGVGSDVFFCSSRTGFGVVE